MSILIKGMEMPKTCHCCRMCVQVSDGDIDWHWECCLLCEKVARYATDRIPGCPLVPVPAHGDLIDRDALRASFRESIDECHKWADEVEKDTMMYARISQSLGTFVECSLRAKAAPTVIEAEEGET